MNQYQYGTTLYSSRSEMLSDMVVDWLTAGGSWDRATIEEFLANATDEQLAAEMVESCGLKRPDEDGASHMEAGGYTVEDLAEVFADLRENPADYINCWNKEKGPSAAC